MVRLNWKRLVEGTLRGLKGVYLQRIKVAVLICYFSMWEGSQDLILQVIVITTSIGLFRQLTGESYTDVRCISLKDP